MKFVRFGNRVINLDNVTDIIFRPKPDWASANDTSERDQLRFYLNVGNEDQTYTKIYMDEDGAGYFWEKLMHPHMIDDGEIFTI